MTLRGTGDTIDCMARWLTLFFLMAGAASAQQVAEPDEPGEARPNEPVRAFNVDQLAGVLDFDPADLPNLRSGPCAIPLTRMTPSRRLDFALRKWQPRADIPIGRVSPPAPPCGRPSASSAPWAGLPSTIDPDLVREVRIKLSAPASEPADPAEPER